MSDKHNAADGQIIAGVPSSTRARGHGRWLIAAIFATGLAAVSMTAFADEVGSGDAHQAGAQGGSYAPIDVTHLKAIVHDLMAKASPEQKEQIVAIAHAAKRDLDAMTQEAMAVRRQKFGLLLQATFDRPALERAQASERQAADRISKRIDQVLADLAELMTPQQRARFREDARAYQG